jgi:hypothetical protein
MSSVMFAVVVCRRMGTVWLLLVVQPPWWVGGTQDWEKPDQCGSRRTHTSRAFSPALGPWTISQVDRPALRYVE